MRDILGNPSKPFYTGPAHWLPSVKRTPSITTAAKTIKLITPNSKLSRTVVRIVFTVVFWSAENELVSMAASTLENIKTPTMNKMPATYETSGLSSAQSSVNVVETTVLDSFSLGVIALIVLAAVVILSILFRLGQ